MANIKGGAELQKFLDQLAPKLEANVMRGALRAGMNVVKPVAQANVHSVSGELAAGLKISTRSSKGVITANLRATGKHGFLGVMVEFGTKVHFIRVRIAKALSLPGGVRSFALHPGSHPKSFMRRALDAEQNSAVEATAAYIKNRLATKEGLDQAADVEIEVTS